MQGQQRQHSAVEGVAPKIRVYTDIGLDSDGRSHHYDAAERQIVVCTEDRRGIGITNDTTAERIDAPPCDEPVAEYVAFVREHVDGLEWAEVDADV